jgi:diguanylate cyclase (GGDEF)-like protein
LAQQVQQRTLELETVIDDLQTRNARLQEENQIDGLTSVNNRLAFEEAFKIEWRRAERQGYMLSLLMFDIDHFKEVNDTFGHLAGDQCLRTVSHLLKSAFNRSADFVARYGGEEFVVLLPYLELDNAILCAERLRAIIEAYVIEYAGSEIRLTVSVGVSCVQPSADIDATQLIKLADKALYSAKDAGRNCVRSIAVA